MEIALKVLKVVPGLKRAVEYFAQKRFNTNVGAPALGHMLIPKGSAENINIYISPKGEGGIGNAHIENLETNISLSFANVTIQPATSMSLVTGGSGALQVQNCDNSALVGCVDATIEACITCGAFVSTNAYLFDASYSIIAGGSGNSFEAANYAAIIGGSNNYIFGGGNSVILGGERNRSSYATASIIFGRYADGRGVDSGLAQGFQFEGVTCHSIRFWYGTGWIDWNTTYVAPSTVLSGTDFYANTGSLDTVASVKLRINIYDDLGNTAHVESRVVYQYDAVTSTLTILNQNNDVVYDGLTAGWTLATVVNSGHLRIEFTGVNPRQYRILAQADLFDNSMPELLGG